MRVDVLKHPSEDGGVDGKDKLRSSFQSPFDPLEGCVQTKIIRREIHTSCMVNILYTAQNIFTVAISACVGHQLHENTQAVCLGREHVQAKEVGEVEPLPDVGQDIVLGGGSKA